MLDMKGYRSFLMLVYTVCIHIYIYMFHTYADHMQNIMYISCMCKLLYLPQQFHSDAFCRYCFNPCNLGVHNCDFSK